MYYHATVQEEGEERREAKGHAKQEGKKQRG
jgi:hypothetical protein